jgi:hypothetical protein
MCFKQQENNMQKPMITLSGYSLFWRVPAFVISISTGGELLKLLYNRFDEVISWEFLLVLVTMIALGALSLTLGVKVSNSEAQ